MECPECGNLIDDASGATECDRCGAPFQVPAQAERAGRSPLGWELLIEEEFDRLHEQLRREEVDRAGHSVGQVEVYWGGFFRRACALAVDIVVLASLSAILFYSGYVGYTVGLAAHHRVLEGEEARFLLRALFAAWICLVGAYFVLLEGMDGKTVGKWVFGLRVVGANQNPITYRQAFVRWLVSVPSALLGLGFGWVLLNREKRAWHDFAAGTWVIREWSRSTTG